MRLRRILAAVSSAVLFSAILVACGGGDDDITGENQGVLGAPEQVSFERISVGGEDIKELEIQNTADSGGGALTISNVQLRQGDADNLREFVPVNPDEFPSPSQKIQIPRGESVSWQIAFRPENGNADEGEVTFDVQNAETSDWTVSLKTSEMNPDINIAPRKNVNFATEPDEVDYKFAKVTNTGRAPLTINDIGISGSDKFTVMYADPSEVTCDIGRTNPFPLVELGDIDDDGEIEEGPKAIEEVAKVMPSGQGDLWPVDELSRSFDPQECFAVIFKFAPTDNTPESASVALTSNAEPSTQSISLSGNSDAPCLEISPSEALQFGTVSTNETTPLTVRIRNCRQRADDLLVSEVGMQNKMGVFEINRATLPGGNKLVDDNENTAIALSGDEQITFQVTATPDRTGTIGDTNCNPETGPIFQVKTNDQAQPTKTLCMEVTGDPNQCPTAVAECKVKGSSNWSQNISTLPLETVVCDATESRDPDGSISRYEWSILQRGSGSNAVLSPSGSVAKPEIKLDVAGDYVLELKVYDNNGVVSCGSPARVEIEAIPDDDIHGQLVWDTPGDPDQTDGRGTDLDLHFLNPDFPNPDANWSWNTAPYDIYWDNPTEDWGIQGDPSDDPQLDIDDRNGAGPENINLSNPQTGIEYKWGVFYYLDRGFGESYATVRIFIQGQLAKEYKNKFLPSTDTFWYVADVKWQENNTKIFTRDIVNENGFPN